MTLVKPQGRAAFCCLRYFIPATAEEHHLCAWVTKNSHPENHPKKQPRVSNLYFSISAEWNSLARKHAMYWAVKVGGMLFLRF